MRSIALSIMLAVAVSGVLAVSAGAAGPLPGRTLSYRITSGGKTSGTVAARTARGRIAILGSNPRPSYVQYDGKFLWACEKGKRCRVASRGAKARKVAEFLETEFFEPYGKHGLARVFMTNPKPAGRRTVGGVASTCRSSSSSLTHHGSDLLCIASHGRFLTLLEAGGETYALRRAVVGVSPSFLAIPEGVWNGQLGG
jgi:hypothetical protein